MSEQAAPGRVSARNVFVHFEGLTAINDVDFVLHRAEILGLIGPNGAGKTTLVNVLTGFQRPAAGRVWLNERETTTWSPHRIARAGLARTFQSVRLFHGLSVLENVEMGAVGCGDGRRAGRRKAYEVMATLALAELADARADALPYGLERRIGIARALATSPAFLLLDEPAAGLNEAEAEDLMHTIASIHRDFGCGVLVIEHNVGLIMGLCDRVQVLDQGQTIAIGTPEEVQRNPAVRNAYLGSA